MIFASFALMVLVIKDSLQLIIQNGVKEAKLSCEDDGLHLNVTTDLPVQYGRIFVKGHSSENQCTRPMTQNATQQQFTALLSSCGMERTGVRGDSNRGAAFSITLVVSFHDNFITKVDKAYRLVCVYGKTTGTTELSNGLTVSMIPATDIEQGIGSLDCNYEIRAENENGSIVRYALVGMNLAHVWTCKNVQPNQFIWVHDCEAVSERGDKVATIDSNGCTKDPVITEDPKYPTKSLAVAKHHAYQFADVSSLHFRCQIELCRSDTPTCAIQDVPPNCAAKLQVTTPPAISSNLNAEHSTKLSEPDKLQPKSTDKTTRTSTTVAVSDLSSVTNKTVTSSTTPNQSSASMPSATPALSDLRHTAQIPPSEEPLTEDPRTSSMTPSPAFVVDSNQTETSAGKLTSDSPYGNPNTASGFIVSTTYNYGQPVPHVQEPVFPDSSASAASLPSEIPDQATHPSIPSGTPIQVFGPPTVFDTAANTDDIPGGASQLVGNIRTLSQSRFVRQRRNKDGDFRQREEGLDLDLLGDENEDTRILVDPRKDHSTRRGSLSLDIASAPLVVFELADSMLHPKHSSSWSLTSSTTGKEKQSRSAKSQAQSEQSESEIATTTTANEIGRVPCLTPGVLALVVAGVAIFVTATGLIFLIACCTRQRSDKLPNIMLPRY